MLDDGHHLGEERREWNLQTLQLPSFLFFVFKS